MPLLSGSTPRHPTHITLPPPFLTSVSITPSPSPRLENPLSSPLISPALTFYTAPSSPIITPLVDEPMEIIPVLVCDPPPQNQPLPPVPHTDDTFPEVSGLDLTLDDEGLEGLNPLEKIYLYSISKATYHRVFISCDLPNLLDQITPQEAVEYVLPLLQVLSKDQDESVREALTSGLASVIWWFLTHCQVVATADNQINSYSNQSTSISVHAFTPILGRLLLSPNGLVGSSAKYVVVNLLQRMREADSPEDQLDNWVAGLSFVSNASLNEDLTIGLFGRSERVLFEQEILWGLVAGLDRLFLDGDLDSLEDRGHTPCSEDSANFSDTITASEELQKEEVASSSSAEDFRRKENINPYFPVEPSAYSNGSFGTVNNNVDSPLSVSSSYSSVSRGPTINDGDREDYNKESQEEQSAVKRLTSMSLMATVTSTGYLDEQAQNTFVKEVERVVMDPIYWVRRESSFVLGALAKVVPDEIVHTSLLPLLERLLVDPAPLVRHSSLFALPVILTRLPIKYRRVLAVHTMQSMSVDESPDVRSGVLEALGEVIHTFHDEYRKPGDDTEGPPAELIRMFIGRSDDKKVWDGQQPALAQPFDRDKMKWLDSFYNDPSRPLICAFNLPAVCMTLGLSRWETLRETYLKLSDNPAFGIRRTLAASVGDLAKVLGPEIAQRDLMPVWWDGLRSQEAEIRLKIVQCLETFVRSLNMTGKMEVLEGVLEAWKVNRWSGWREREHIAGCLSAVIQSVASQEDQEVAHLLQLVCGLLRFALIDNVNAIREAGIHTLPLIWPVLQRYPKVLGNLHLDLQGLSCSGVFRQRMTYIACQQVLLLPDGDTEAIKVPDEELWTTLRALSNDPIVGVRIGVSRLIASLYAYFWTRTSPPVSVIDLAKTLSQDSSHEVISYVSGLSLLDHGRHVKNFSQVSRHAATFSRPPSALPGSELNEAV
ncbi:ARM repeat-containing protein [Guyanagaster necrorhizus]|uniref:ARM repeat-containing protein n=1 Tax=Guyanagaster necrorhizus TaxID=856835 RepID=A0A9P8AY78_9AGAR|nr:ARM repeat-containing protein [Guyanagaster necrorhizus MCA 3950]KAG7452614.1 ARM repeat-containing protein [Guyanagaster necrorhizus MCA 3950]